MISKQIQRKKRDEVERDIMIEEIKNQIKRGDKVIINKGINHIWGMNPLAYKISLLYNSFWCKAR